MQYVNMHAVFFHPSISLATLASLPKLGEGYKPGGLSGPGRPTLWWLSSFVPGERSETATTPTPCFSILFGLSLHYVQRTLKNVSRLS